MSLTRRKALGCACTTMAVLLSTVASASANNLYVSATTGADTNAGTSTAPVKTISRAAKLAHAGDVVNVGPGVYPETVSLTKASNGVTFQSSGATPAVVAGGGTRAFGFNLYGTTGTRIQGFDISKQTQVGVMVKSGVGNVVANNTIHDVGTQVEVHSNGVRVVWGQDNQVRGNVIHSIGPGQEAMGVWLLQTRQAIVDANVIYLVRKEGIRDWQGIDNVMTANRSMLNQTGIAFNTSTGSYAANNVLSDNVTGFVAKHVSYSTVLNYWKLSAAHLSRFTHNTITGSTEESVGLGLSDEPMDYLDVTNNVFQGGGMAFVRDVPSLRGPHVTLDSNQYVVAGGPTAIYKQGWAKLPAPETDWTAYRSRLGWEAHGVFGPAASGSPTAAGVGGQFGAPALPPAPVSWTPYAMRPVDSSSKGSWSTQTSLAGVADGNQNTYWMTNTAQNEYVTLDFGQPRAFNTIIVSQFSHLDPRNAHGYRFDVSDDGQSWRTIVSGTNPDSAGNALKYELPGAVTARYLRYTLVDTSCSSYSPRTNCGTTFIVSDVAAGLLS
jgi:hypothetical protein